MIPTPTSTVTSSPQTMPSTSTVTPTLLTMTQTFSTNSLSTLSSIQSTSTTTHILASNFSTTSQTTGNSTNSPNTTVVTYSIPSSSNSRQNTFYTTQAEITSQSVTTEMEITLLHDSYIDFTLSGNFDFDTNQTANDTARALLQIFLQCFPAAHAQQIEITFSRARTLASAQIRLFNTPTLSAQTLYQGISQQLSDPSSQLRRNEMTAQLTRDSIVNTETWYYCANNIVQENPCNSSTDKLSLATVIVPTIIGGILLFAGILLLFIFVRRRSHRMTEF